MKKIVTVCLILSLALISCEQAAQNPPSQTTSPPELNVADKIALDAAEARAAYYQGLVAELQKEILAMKSAHASARVEYELRIEELEVALGLPQASPGSDFQYTVQDGKITVTAYIGDDTVVSIPEQISGCPVTYIADAAFENNTALEKVILPATLEGIGWFAFRGCIALTEVTAGGILSKIEYGAFENCNAKLTFICPADSYAEEYAQSYGYATKKA